MTSRHSPVPLRSRLPMAFSGVCQKRRARVSLTMTAGVAFASSVRVKSRPASIGMRKRPEIVRRDDVVEKEHVFV